VPEALLPAMIVGRGSLELSLMALKDALPFAQNQLGAKHIRRAEHGIERCCLGRMLLLGEQDLAVTGHDSFDSNNLVMVTLRRAIVQLDMRIGTDESACGTRLILSGRTTGNRKKSRLRVAEDLFRMQN